MTTPPKQSARALDVVTDARHTFFFQIPAVILHRSVIEAHGLQELSLSTVRHEPSGREFAAWIVGDDDEHWATAATAPGETARLSLAAWRSLAPYAEARSGARLQVSWQGRRLPVWPAHIERLLTGNEIGLHREDAAAMGLGRWAVVNCGEVAAMCRVRLANEERDRGVARLSFQARLLLGVVSDGPRRPEVLVSPVPKSRGRELAVPEPRWLSSDGRRVRRWRIWRLLASAAERASAVLLGAPAIAFRTTSVAPGEEQALTVRLAEELFPLLGIQPGDQVYVEWGPRNRAAATALASYTGDPEPLPSIEQIGRVARQTAEAPPLVQLHVGAATRAALGIPRTTVVSVRRRVIPQVLSRLNELIVPATGLTIGFAADIRLRAWQWLGAVVIIVGLLLAPLRVRRTPGGRLP